MFRASATPFLGTFPFIATSPRLATAPLLAASLAMLLSTAACRNAEPQGGPSIGSRAAAPAPQPSAVPRTASAVPSTPAGPSASAAPAGQVLGSAKAECRAGIPYPDYPENPTTPAAQVFGEGYQFTQDWFTRNIPTWKSLLTEWQGKAGVKYLEVGSFEGMSALWMLKQVLTGSGSTVEGVDPYFDQTVKARATHNLAHAKESQRYTLHQGLSSQVLPRLTPRSYDIIYIDGSHTADDVLADAVLCWLLIKPGGILIFDDWQMEKSLTDELRPGVAIDAFITAYRRRLDLVHRGYQVVVRKRADDDCNTHPFCTPMGQSYFYPEQKEVRQASGQPIPLTGGEKLLLERLSLTRRFGAARDELVAQDLAALGDRPALVALAAKLGLKLP